mmetsp:Transcript_21648/g.46068  ORF Transcript_21648/g.46068 Transcript_21648/m.46068 type:complete len:273 (-) Transcript_21648:230-1048(-)
MAQCAEASALIFPVALKVARPSCAIFIALFASPFSSNAKTAACKAPPMPLVYPILLQRSKASSATAAAFRGFSLARFTSHTISIAATCMWPSSSFLKSVTADWARHSASSNCLASTCTRAAWRDALASPALSSASLAMATASCAALSADSASPPFTFALAIVSKADDAMVMSFFSLKRVTASANEVFASAIDHLAMQASPLARCMHASPRLSPLNSVRPVSISESAATKLPLAMYDFTTRKRLSWAETLSLFDRKSESAALEHFNASSASPS